MKGHLPRKSNKILTSQELADVQQPIDKDGYTNDYFNKLYGEDKNPYTGTERDRKKRKRISGIQPADWLIKKVLTEYHKTKNKELKQWLQMWTDIKP